MRRRAIASIDIGGVVSSPILRIHSSNKTSKSEWQTHNPNTLSILRLRGNSDWYPIFASAASALGSDTDSLLPPPPDPVTDKLRLPMMAREHNSQLFQFSRCRCVSTKTRARCASQPKESDAKTEPWSRKQTTQTRAAPGYTSTDLRAEIRTLGRVSGAALNPAGDRAAPFQTQGELRCCAQTALRCQTALSSKAQEIVVVCRKECASPKIRMLLRPMTCCGSAHDEELAALQPRLTRYLSRQCVTQQPQASSPASHGHTALGDCYQSRLHGASRVQERMHSWFYRQKREVLMSSPITLYPPARLLQRCNTFSIRLRGMQAYVSRKSQSSSPCPPS